MRMNKALHVSHRGESLSRAVLLAMAAVSVTSAQGAKLIAGGDTLSAVGYEGPSLALGGLSGTRLADPATADSGSLFGALQAGRTTFGISYCQTGSGAGKRVLGGIVNYAADNACGTFAGTPTPFGFSGPLTTPRTLDPDFVASDAPTTQAEYNAVINSWGTKHTAPVQFPVVAAAVGILYNNSALASLNLTDAQVCQIFSGQITNWAQLSTTAQPISAAPMTVVYRSDGSGTTFALANHLAAVCSLPVGHFTTDQTFTPNVLSDITPGGAVQSNFIPVSGDPAVVSKIYVTNNSIGYGSVADAESSSPAIKHATVNSLDPIRNFSISGTFHITTTTGMVVTGVNYITGKPTLGPITGGAQTQCMVIADPNTYAIPVSGYPIVAISNFLAYFSGNGAKTSDLRYVLSGPYDVTNVQENVFDIGPFAGSGNGNGLIWVSDAGNGNNTTVAKVTGCINP